MSAAREPSVAFTEVTPTLRRWFAVAGTLTLLVVAAGTGTGLALRDRLPARVASHYGPDGVDATESLTVYLVTAAVALGVLTLLLGALGVAMPGDARRMLGTLQAGITGWIGVVLYGSLLGQLDRPVPEQGAGPGPWLAGGVLVGVLLAWPARRLLAPARMSPTAAPARPVAAASGSGRVLAWSGRTGWSVGAPVIIALLAALAVGFGLWLDPWAGLIPAAVAASMVAMLQGRVRIDQDGVQVRSFGRITWVSIPLPDVALAEAEAISPLRDFGGYGIRYGLRGRGFVTRAGDALRIEGQDGSSTWVTVDDATGAATVLNALVADGPGTTAGPIL